MRNPIAAPPLAGRILGSTQNSFVVAERSDPGGSTERRLIAPLHLHARDDEAWYVLEGSLCVQVGDDEVRASAGSGVFVPAGTPHTYWNPGPEPVRYLLLMTANIYQLIEDIHAMKERTPAALANVFRRHDSELLSEQP